MRTNNHSAGPTGSPAAPRLPRPTVLGRILAAFAGAFVLVGAFVFSLFLFAAVAAIGLVLGGYLWWKTRELRRRMREQPPGGRVIEGEVIRDRDPQDRLRP